MRSSIPQYQYEEHHQGRRIALAVAIALLALLLIAGSYVLGRQSIGTGLNPSAGVGAQNLTTGASNATVQPGTNSTGTNNTGNTGGNGGGGTGSNSSGGSGSSGGTGSSGGSGGSGGTGGSGGSGNTNNSGGSGGGGNTNNGGSNTPAPTPTPTLTPAHISVTPSEIVLHIGTDGLSTTRSLTISNSGDTTLSYNMVGLPSFASLNRRSGTVAPHSSTTVTINFLMTGLGLLTTNIEIDNSSSNAPVVKIPVRTQIG